VFFILLVGIAGLAFWMTRQAIDPKEIGQIAGVAAADSVKQQTDEIIEQAISKSTDEMIERTGEVATAVVHETINKAEDRVRDLSDDDVFAMLEDIKDTGLRATRDLAYDVVPIWIEDEWTIGQQIGDSLREQMTVIEDPFLQQRVEQLAEPILARLKRTAGKQYQITVMQSDEINAFAILGGQVFLASGLIERMGSNSTIQSVIAHEIAHVELEHCVRGAWFGIKAQGTLGPNVLASVLTNINQLAERGFTEQQELESDEFAFRVQYHLEISKLDRVRFIDVLKEIESKNKSEQPDEQKNPVLAALDRHYRTHPDASERYSRLMDMKDDPALP
jgi:predicted Zn-dependent protease